MKFLHTSDWHLGRSLYGRKRYAEFAAFLDWLTQTIEDEKVDACWLPVMCSIPARPATGRRSFTIASFAVWLHPAAVMLWSLPGTTIRRHF